MDKWKNVVTKGNVRYDVENYLRSVRNISYRGLKDITTFFLIKNCVEEAEFGRSYIKPMCCSMLSLY